MGDIILQSQRGEGSFFPSKLASGFRPSVIFNILIQKYDKKKKTA